jgi:hypothetical protein
VNVAHGLYGSRVQKLLEAFGIMIVIDEPLNATDDSCGAG